MSIYLDICKGLSKCITLTKGKTTEEEQTHQNETCSHLLSVRGYSSDTTAVKDLLQLWGVLKD